MSIARVQSFAFSGIEAVPVEVQVQISSGLPAFLVVGPITQKPTSPLSSHLSVLVPQDRPSGPPSSGDRLDMAGTMSHHGS
jgi:hypothetical protein